MRAKLAMPPVVVAALLSGSACGGGDDQADVRAAIDEHQAVIGEVFAGESDIERLEDIATGDALEVRSEIANVLTDEDLVMDQVSEIVDVSVEIDGAEASADVCLAGWSDAIRHIEEDPVEPEEAVEPTMAHWTLQRDDDATHGWIVSEVESTEDPCDAGEST